MHRYFEFLEDISYAEYNSNQAHCIGEDKYVQKCSTRQSFIFPKFTSFKIGTLIMSFGGPFGSIKVHECQKVHSRELCVKKKEKKKIVCSSF